MTYDGNRLSSVTDSGSEESGTHTYAYDASGNLTRDGRKRLEFTHNVLNLPMSVRERDASGQHMTGDITYTYLGDGAAVVNLSAPQSASTGAFILEQNGYHPFGTKIDLGCNLSTNRWRYAGKEEQDIAGMDLRLLDFGARFYGPYTLRWNAVDPLAHKYFDMSPYNYCGNDPVNRFDPDGKVEVLARAAVGALVGAAVEIGVAYAQGKRGNELRGSAVRGAIEGAVIGATLNVDLGFAVVAAVNAASSAAGSIANQAISGGSVNWGRVGKDASVGATVGLGMNAVAKTVQKSSASVLSKTIEKIKSPETMSQIEKGIKSDLKKSGARIGSGTKQKITNMAKKEVSDRVNIAKVTAEQQTSVVNYSAQKTANTSTEVVLEYIEEHK